MLTLLREEIQRIADSKKAKILQRFFKTGPGEYGEGDIFLGITVPQSRILAKRFGSLPLKDNRTLISSKIHEERLIALLILSEQFKKALRKDTFFRFYLKNTRHINNWDLVDLTAPNIVGTFLEKRSRAILLKLARSSSLWERRIAIVATFHFIRNNEFNDTLRIAKILLTDNEDLIRKATGWMLREVGKRNESVLKKFLKKNYPHISRTTLRYAIEKFPPVIRKKYLAGTIS